MEIYDSRNYISLLASGCNLAKPSLSTIVEIILAYQPAGVYMSRLGKSTIVEIILAYQPPSPMASSYQLYLRQQKLYQLISRKQGKITFIASTIVEIILAYQPNLATPKYLSNLRQQKLYQLISLTIEHISRTSHLRQQKLYQLISLKIYTYEYF